MPSLRWFFEPSAPEGLNLVDYQALAQNALADREGWEGISGGYRQCNLLKIPHGKQLQQRLAQVVLQQAASIEGAELPADLVPKHFKLLQAHPGSGPQAPHRDGLSKKHYVVALYLTTNRSTDVNVESAQWDGELTSFDVQPGSLMVFREDMIHRGVKNEAGEDLLVMFMVLGPAGEAHNDNYQHFEWSEAADEDSPEYYAALVRNKQYKPVSHIADVRKRQQVRKYMKIYQQAQAVATAQGYEVTRRSKRKESAAASARSDGHPSTGDLRPAKRSRA
jgi:hypothetical protein